MMFLARNRGCNGRKNPRLSAALGLLSAVMIGFGGYLSQHDDIRTPVALAVGFGILAIGAVLVRFVALRDADR